MQYEKSLMAKWDEYAILKTAEDRGYEKGRLESKVEVVKNLIVISGFSDAAAAEIAEVPVKFVKNVRRGLKK